MTDAPAPPHALEPRSGAVVPASPTSLSPPALDPRVIERHVGVDPVTRQPLSDRLVEKMAFAVGGAQQSALRLRTAEATLSADQTLSPQARALKLRDLATTIGTKTAALLDSATARMATEMASITAGCRPGAPRDALASEIRTRIASLSHEARGTAIGQAIEARDGAIIGAILSAPGLLTGLPPAELEVIEARWREAVHPEVAQRLRRLEAASDDARRAGQTFVGIVKAMTESQLAKEATAQAEATARATRHAVPG